MSQEEIMQQLIDYAYDKMEQENAYPFCAFVVKDGEIIARGFNSRVNDFGDKTMHGEMEAMKSALNQIIPGEVKGVLSFPERYEMYSTCESCLACLDTAIWARIQKFVFSVDHKDFPEYFQDHNYTAEDYQQDYQGKFEIVSGVLKEEGKALFMKAKEKYGW